MPRIRIVKRVKIKNYNLDMEQKKNKKITSKQQEVDRVFAPNSNGYSEWITREILDTNDKLSLGKTGQGVMEFSLETRVIYGRRRRAEQQHQRFDYKVLVKTIFMEQNDLFVMTYTHFINPAAPRVSFVVVKVLFVRITKMIFTMIAVF